MTRRKTKEEDIKTKGEVLVQFVLKRYNYSKTNMAARHAKWARKPGRLIMWLHH